MVIIGVMQTVIESIREMIITGELIPGQKLNESTLAAQFNISRPPLREAFRILENDLLVVSITRKGCYVTKISIEDFRKFHEARAMIESYAIDVLKQNNVRSVFADTGSGIISDEEIPAAWETIDKKERLRCLNLLVEFHANLVQSTGNSLLIHFRQTLVYNLARYQYKYPYSIESYKVSCEFHRQIKRHIELGAFDTAKAILQDHLRTFAERFEQMMKDEKYE